MNPSLSASLVDSQSTGPNFPNLSLWCLVGLNTHSQFASSLWVLCVACSAIIVLLGTFRHSLGALSCLQIWLLSSHVSNSHTMSWHVRSSWCTVSLSSSALSVSLFWFWSITATYLFIYFSSNIFILFSLCSFWTDWKWSSTLSLSVCLL